MQAVSEKLHAGGGSGLKRHHDLARDRALGRDRFGSPQAHETRGIGHVVLPATPGHRVPLTHQEAIARIEGFSGGDILGTVEIAQARTAPAIQDIKQQAVVAALRLHRPEESANPPKNAPGR